MMSASVYILTGFLDSGKTTLLSKIIRKRRNRKILVIQFEEGEEELEISPSEYEKYRHLIYSKKELDTDFDTVSDEIAEEIELGNYDEIWIEWNGMEPFSSLEKIFLQRQLSLFLHIEKVIYLADVPLAEQMLGQTGEGPVSQAASSDVAFLRHAKDPVLRKKFTEELKTFAPSLEIYNYTGHVIAHELQKKKGNPVVEWIGWAAWAGILIALVPLFSRHGIPLMKAVTIFMGVFLQAVPFLILGVLLSSAIQTYVSEKCIAKIFPKKTIPSMIIGIIAGFFLPVCDCASIPVFKSLIRKGIPLPAAVCFMTASPVINPVVILSTYHAYNGNIRAVLYRCGTGILCSFLIGLTFLIRSPEDFLRNDADMGNFYTCGCYVSGTDSDTFMGKFNQFCIHARMEFYTVSRYLLAGIGTSVLFQMLNLNRIGTLGNQWISASVFFMMLLAFLLSLCSSSDAVVARSLSGTSNFIPTLGFLVYGPMMDIKNVIMLHSYFKKKFILRLVITVTVICYGVVVVLGVLTGGIGI